MNPSNEYIKHICDLYNDYYDDRIEESNPPTAGNNPKTAGEDWRPGVSKGTGGRGYSSINLQD